MQSLDDPYDFQSSFILVDFCKDLNWNCGISKVSVDKK